MIKYFPVQTVTARSTTSVDSKYYSYTATGMTQNALNEHPSYVKTNDNKFYKILFVINGTIYLSNEILVGDGVLIKNVTNNEVKELEVTTTRTITLK